VGSLSLIHGQSNFDGEVVKHCQNANHDSRKFQVFFKGNLIIHFFIISFGSFCMKLVFGQVFQVNLVCHGPIETSIKLQV
jgi:hypothetical protein